MNAPNLAVLLLALLFLHGCNKCDDKPLNEVRIRVQNNLRVDINSIMIGSTMYRGANSFASCSMTEGFGEVLDGQLTEYTTTYGNHLGYDGVRIDWNDGIRDALRATTDSAEIFESELLRNSAVEDSVANVYTGDMIFGLSLPDGDYTFHLLSFLPTQNPVIEVEIIKDI